VKGFREAQQLSALLVLPVIALLLGQATGYLILGNRVMIMLAAAILVIDAVIFGFGLRLFQREKILSQSR
jgi:ABC-2 type transport system permease protein